MKKIPYGISDYKTIVNKDYLYIDKTMYIEKLEELSEPYILMLRPRRFGKSLFASVLEYYYDLKYKNEFSKLFKNTYIGANPTLEKNSYYILKFNFSALNTSSYDLMLSGFKNKIENAVNSFVAKYSLKYKIKVDMMPEELLQKFFSDMENILDGSIYIIIDEYDHFANELLGFKIDIFDEVIGKNGFVRKWYEAIKIGTSSGLVQKLFITGVTPITLDSMTSGFNIGKNKSFDSQFNECFGFNENELRWILSETIKENIDIEKEIPLLKKYYNGYLFSPDSKQRVYNSDMVLYYITEFIANNKRPKQLIDTNITSDYTKISQLFELKNGNQNMLVLKGILDNIPQDTLLTPIFNISNKFDVDDFNSLLYYLGFLTISKIYDDSVELSVPNYVVKELYFNYFTKLIQEQSQLDIEISDIRKAIRDISKSGDISKFIDIIASILNKLSFRDFIKFDEKYIKTIMISYLMLSKIYYVKSEYEVEDGYIDIALLPKNETINMNYAIIEIKYIAKSKFTKEILDNKIDEARNQILKYSRSEELLNLKNLIKWIIIWTGDKVAYIEKVEK